MTPGNDSLLKTHIREAVRLCGCKGNLLTAQSLRLVLEVEYSIPSGSLEIWQVTAMLKAAPFVRTCDGWTYELLGPTVRPARE